MCEGFVCVCVWWLVIHFGCVYANFNGIDFVSLIVYSFSLCVKWMDFFVVRSDGNDFFYEKVAII